MLECLIQFPSLSGHWWPAEPSLLAGAIFFKFRQIPLNGANHTDKTDIPAVAGMDTFSSFSGFQSKGCDQYSVT